MTDEEINKRVRDRRLLLAKVQSYLLGENWLIGDFMGYFPEGLCLSTGTVLLSWNEIHRLTDHQATILAERRYRYR